MSEKVTPETEPVAPAIVLMRMPFAELDTVESEMVTFLTVLSSRLPTEPIDRPWPPEQVPPVNMMFYIILVITALCSIDGFSRGIEETLGYAQSQS